MLKRLAAVAAAGALAAVALAGPVAANDETDAHLPAAPWQAVDNGTDPAAASTIVDPWTVRLVEDGSTDAGTSVETTDLGLTVEDGAEVSFAYELQGGAECSPGSPRVFVIIDGTNTNSWDSGAECGTDGTVAFTIPTGGAITHAGLVHDNFSQGAVTFRELVVGGTPVLFGEVCEWDSTIGGGHEKCQKPDPDPTDTADPTDPPGKGGEDKDDEALPNTGASTGILAGGAVALAVLGGGLYWLARRRQMNFTA